MVWEAPAVGHDQGEGGGEALVAVEGAGLPGLLADGAVEAFEDAGRAEAAGLPGSESLPPRCGRRRG